MKASSLVGALLVCSLAGGAGSVLAGPGAPGVPPSYGHDFVTITHAGNRPVLESEGFYLVKQTGFPNQGQVNYDYRISRTETTVGQWFDFVNVAWPVAQAQGHNTRNDSRFLGSYIQTGVFNPNLPPNYFVLGPDAFGRHADNVATSMSFRFAAWYCNWLHNGRPTTNITLDTFTTGAYDTTTFTRQAGAKFWIPSLDEWTKAVYYDPNRYGPGQEGYWQYSGMSTVPLVGGPPSTPGAQTSGGAWYLPGTHGLPPDVGSYAQTLSPWGLLDTSGGEREWTDTPSWFVIDGVRMIKGQDLSLSTNFDRVDHLFSVAGFDNGGTGLRIASLVPSPGAGAAILLGAMLSAGRRRRM